MGTTNSLIQTYVPEQKMITLEDQPTHKVKHTGPSCYLREQNILIRGESKKRKDSSHNCVVILIDPSTGRPKGTKSLFMITVSIHYYFKNLPILESLL